VLLTGLLRKAALRAGVRSLVHACGVALGLTAIAHPLPAQANNGALDLLLPVGARATGMGGAFVAEQGSEAVWWNPAGMARLTKAEFGLDHFETVFIKGDALSLIIPVRSVGAFGLSARLFNYGESTRVDTAGVETGTLLNRTVVFGASFSAPVGKNLDAGVTFHLYQGRNDCVGACDSGLFTTSAVDAGVLFRPVADGPLRIGFEVRNLGPSLQVHDKPQADALPTRVHLGATYDPVFAQLSQDIRVRGSAEVVTGLGLGDAEFRAGVQAGYVTAQSTLLVRAGYVAQPGSAGSSSTGPSLGIGLAQGRVALDLSRIFETFSTGLGTPPTYISIRVRL
jgi:hypothetical protein